MSIQQQIMTIWVIILSVSILSIPIFIARAKRKQSGKQEKYNIAKLEKKYTFYSNFFLTRKNFNSILKSYQSLSCMTQQQIKNKSIKLFEKSVTTSLAIPVGLIITTQDIVIGLLGLLISLVYYNLTIEKDIDDVYRLIIKEVSVLVQSIVLNYMEFNNIPRAILESDRGQYLTVIVDDMYNVLSDVDSENKLRDFINKSPLKTLTELMSVCQITKEHGDERNERGESKFVEQLGVIEKEINLEIKVLHLQKQKFNLLDKITLAGIIAMPAVDWFLLSKIPGTAIIVKGVLGMAIKVFILLITMVAYYVISVINKKSVVSGTDFSESTYQLSQNKRIRRFIDSIKPKSYKNVIKMESLLEESLSSHSIETFYTEKIIYCVFMGLLGLFLSITFIITARNYIYNRTGTLSFLPIIVEKRMQEEIDRMDTIYMELEEKPVGQELLDFIDSNVRNLNMIDLQEQAARLNKKWNTYSNIYFKWNYILIIYGMGVIGWFAPNMKIKLRKFLVQFEAEEDASQLQTVMITLSGTGLSVYEILHRLLDLSTIHKNSISYACQTFVKDPEFALDVLSDNSKIPEFKRMCTKLKKSIFTLPIRDAFKNIVVEKEQSLAIKEMDAVNMVNKKANLANMLAMAPAACVLILQALLPLLILGFKQMMDMQANLGGM
jgi:hypothetical protein